MKILFYKFNEIHVKIFKMKRQYFNFALCHIKYKILIDNQKREKEYVI